jgi:hypothetical protein
MYFLYIPRAENVRQHDLEALFIQSPNHTFIQNEPTNQPTSQPSRPISQPSQPTFTIINYVVNSAFLNGKQNESQSFKELP